jgi:hypothetical protein
MTNLAAVFILLNDLFSPAAHDLGESMNPVLFYWTLHHVWGDENKRISGK